jgi:hypothetical protein
VGEVIAINVGEKKNVFIIHSQPMDLSALAEGAIGHRTECLNEGRKDEFHITGIIHTPVDKNKDYKNHTANKVPVTFIKHHDIKQNYCRAAEVLEEYANDCGLHDFVYVGTTGLAMMVLGATYENTDIEGYEGLITIGEAGEAGVSWDNVENFVLGEVLEQCLCGRPDTVTRFMHDILLCVAGPRAHEEGVPFAESHWAKTRAAAEAKYGDGPMYFAWHFLENKNFLEHGSSAPGWFTGEGSWLFHALDHCIIQHDADEAEEEASV